MDASDSAAEFAHAAAPDARELAASVTRLLAAWQALLQAEFALAGRSLRALAIALILAPVLLLGLWLSAIVLTLLALQATGLGWLPCAAIVCALQVLLAAWLLRAMKRWSRDVSLRQTRAVLIRVLEPRP